MNTAPAFTHTADCHAQLMGETVLFLFEQTDDVMFSRDLITDQFDQFRELNTYRCPTGRDGCAKLALGLIETELHLDRNALRHAPNDGSRSIHAGRITELVSRRTAIRNLIGV